MALIYNEETGNFDDIPSAPIIHRFEVRQPASVFYVGERIELNWQVNEAHKVYINNAEVQGSSLTVPLTSSGHTQFVLKAVNSDGFIERTLSVSVVSHPTFNVSSSASILREGEDETATLRWSIRNANRVILHYNGINQTVSNVGETTVSPQEDTCYEFEAVGLDGRRRFLHRFTIKVREPARITFNASRLFSYPNLPIELSWAVEHARSVSIDGLGGQPSTGHIEVTPGMDTTYVLRVADDFGESQRTLTIRMLPLPAIKEIYVPTPQIEQTVVIRHNAPTINVDVPMPTFHTPLATMDLPSLPRIKFETLDWGGRKPRKNRNLTTQVKSLFTYFSRNITNLL